MKCDCDRTGLSENTPCPECYDTLVKKPYTMDEIIKFDAIELRDHAAWFDERDKKIVGDFLRQIANKLEILWGAYCTASNDRDGKNLKV